MREITTTRQGSYITVNVKSDENKTSFFCRDIRGSLVWPTISSPGYYLIFAQRNEPNVHSKFPLLLLREGQEELPNKLFESLAKNARLLSCTHFYTDLAKEYEGLRSLFYDYCKYQRFSNIKLTRAPLVENIKLGLMLVMEWVKDEGLNISKETILHKQLGQVSFEDIDKVEKDFYAVNALRLLVGSLEKEPWRPGDELIDVEASRRRHREKADARGWT